MCFTAFPHKPIYGISNSGFNRATIHRMWCVLFAMSFPLSVRRYTVRCHSIASASRALGTTVAGVYSLRSNRVRATAVVHRFHEWKFLLVFFLCLRTAFHWILDRTSLLRMHAFMHTRPIRSPFVGLLIWEFCTSSLFIQLPQTHHKKTRLDFYYDRIPKNIIFFIPLRHSDYITDGWWSAVVVTLFAHIHPLCVHIQRKKFC